MYGNDAADYGGYDASFVSEVLSDLKCIVCHLVLKKPVQVIECGHRFCEQCFKTMKDYSANRNTELSCPLDRMVINPYRVFNDKGAERTVLSSQVKCAHLTKGCAWVGDLRDLKEHVETDCNYEKVKCSNQRCGKLMLRNMLQDHIAVCGGQKTRNMQDEKSFRTLIDDLTSRLLVCEMEAKQKEERLSKCEYKLKETEQRLIHSEADLLKKDATIEKMQVTISNLCNVATMGYFKWTVNNYDAVKWNEKLKSPTFLSSYNGYKCRLIVQWYGLKRGKMGLFFELLQSENNQHLTWPFPMIVRLKSTNCFGDTKCISVCYEQDGSIDSWKIPNGREFSVGIGSREFLQMPQLSNFVVNNTITFCCYLTGEEI